MKMKLWIVDELRELSLYQDVYRTQVVIPTKLVSLSNNKNQSSIKCKTISAN